MCLLGAPPCLCRVPPTRPWGCGCVAGSPCPRPTANTVCPNISPCYVRFLLRNALALWGETAIMEIRRRRGSDVQTSLRRRAPHHSNERSTQRFTCTHIEGCKYTCLRAGKYNHVAVYTYVHVYMLLHTYTWYTPGTPQTAARAALCREPKNIYARLRKNLSKI